MLFISKIKAFFVEHVGVHIGAANGLEIFILLFMGQLGQALINGKPIHWRIILGNLMLNAVITSIIINTGKWREWSDSVMYLIAGAIGVIGINFTVAVAKKYIQRLSK
ncbi:hypothetical protein [uncultured Paraglaciecola sp.]|uniref:hypothetical protein n=1 Tax=uncultured Paraglaciecola sp. TaxID=1765024 RepID=UPI0026330364|nr:hypothetical protein [uncultured Paraglaciecola sp.]